MTRERVAVIGSGVAGLTAAHLLRRTCEVLLIEAASKPGGHADTHDIETPDGRTVALDKGFLVHNRTTYPLLCRLFDELGVRTRDTEMSMSVRCQGCGLAYAGGKRGFGMVPECPPRVLPAYFRMLAEIPRFYRAARELLETSADDTDVIALERFLVDGSYSRYFTDHFVLPIVSAVWSTSEDQCLRYPARSLFAFLRNHGMLSPTGNLPWHSVVGGSRSYVDKIAAGLPHIEVDCPVRSVRRHFDGVEVITAAGAVHDVDKVVIATHADQALALLADPTAAEKQVLSAFRYSENETWLHTDSSVMSNRDRVRASWNHLKPSCRGHSPVRVHYDLNRLMGLSEPVDYLVTLNAAGQVDESRILARMAYRHPTFTADTLAAQRSLGELRSGRTAFAGAYHGWGFHEDGCRSGMHAAQGFGVRW